MKKPKAVFYSMIMVFVLLIVLFVIQNEIEPNTSLFPLIATLGFAFFTLGVILILAARKVKSPLKKYLLATGISATGILVFTILHNLVYGLFIYLFGPEFWGIGGDEPVFFILAIIVCPIVFLVGVIGSMIVMHKK